MPVFYAVLQGGIFPFRKAHFSIYQEAYMLDLFRSFIRIPSPSGNERAFADVLKARLLAMGLFVAEDNAGAAFGGNTGNVFAVLEAYGGTEANGKTGPDNGTEPADVIMFTAHMDRVPGGDRIHPRIHDDGRMTSDGQSILAADDVAGICAILKGIEKVILSGKPHGRVELLFTVSEEYGLLGSRNLDTSVIQAGSAYCMDSSGRIGRVILSAPAIDHIHISVYGKKAHAGAEPEKGINAIKAAAAFLSGVREGRLDPESTANYGIVRGGSATNIICDQVDITGEARSRDEKKLKAYEAYAEAFLKETVSGMGAGCNFSVEEEHGAFSVSPDDETVIRIAHALEKIGVTPKIEAGGGGMDANILNEKGITTVGVATGYLKNHTFEEELYIEDMYKAAELVEALILR